MPGRYLAKECGGTVHESWAGLVAKQMCRTRQCSGVDA